MIQYTMVMCHICGAELFYADYIFMSQSTI